MRGRKENHIAGVECAIVGRRKCQICNSGVPPEIREHRRNKESRLGAGRDCAKVSVGVLRQQTQQLDTGISRAANDTDSDQGGRD
jgi:hypothetical protein